MLTLQRFKTMRLIVGVLIVGFGLSVVFHALDVHGHGSSQPQKTVYTVITSEKKDSKDYYKKCKVCDEAWRKVTITKTTTTTRVTIQHYHLAGEDNWSLQSTKDSTSTTRSSSETWAECPNPNCAG